jgi:hypothetical protein
MKTGERSGLERLRTMFSSCKAGGRLTIGRTKDDGSFKLLSLALVIALALIPCRADDVLCQASGSPEDVAKRLLTEKTEFAHPVVELSLPSSEHSSVVLTRQANDVNTNFRGWVVAPTQNQSCAYRSYELPEMIEPPGLFDIDVIAVFGALSGPQKQRYLVVLYRYHKNGSESDSGYASYVYGWNGSGFESQPKLADRVVGLKTAATIRSRLSK